MIIRVFLLMVKYNFGENKKKKITYLPNKKRRFA